MVVKDEINKPIEKSFRVKFVRNDVLSICRLELSSKGGRAGGSKSFRSLLYVCRGVWSLWFVGAASVFCMSVRLSSGPPGSRPCARLKASTPLEAPTPTKDENTGPHNRELAQYEDQSNAESTNLQNFDKEGRLCRPWSPASTPSSDILPEQPSWSRNIPLMRINAMTPGWPVGLQDSSGETCSLSEETKAPQSGQLVPPATRHEHSQESLPHMLLVCTEKHGESARFSLCDPLTLLNSPYRSSLAGFYGTRAQLISGRCIITVRSKEFGLISLKQKFSAAHCCVFIFILLNFMPNNQTELYLE